MRLTSLLSIALACLFASFASADDKKDTKPAGPVTLSVVSKKDKYLFDGGGKTAEEYKKDLEEIAKKADKGERVMRPKPLAVDLVLVLTNTTKEDVTVHLGGDPNVYTFELTGGTGAVTMTNLAAFTADFKLPKAVKIEAGKTYEIPVKVLADGSRGFSRLVFWTGPGEYKLSAKYTLSSAKGDKVEELKSEPVKIVVAEK
jgi:hypothetical protein